MAQALISRDQVLEGGTVRREYGRVVPCRERRRLVGDEESHADTRAATPTRKEEELIRRHATGRLDKVRGRVEVNAKVSSGGAYG